MRTQFNLSDSLCTAPRISAPNILVTGATGFIGSHFLHRRRSQGTAVCLVRGEDVSSAEARLESQMQLVADSYESSNAKASNRRVVLGDISQPNCGMSDEDLSSLRELGIDTFWHFAASLAHHESARDRIESQNVEGVRHALRLAAALGVKRFVHVSTAYTAGRGEGAIPEDLHSPEGEFNNVYEQTKCRGEHEVMSFCREHGIDVRILRPDIIIGPRETFRSGGTRSGLYGFLSTLDRFRRHAEGLDQSLIVAGDHDIPIHLTPIDDLVDDMLTLEGMDFKGGPIYHLTSRGSLTVGQCFQRVCEVFGVRGVELGDASRARRHAPQVILNRRLDFFLGYLRHPKHFTRSLDGEKGVTLDEFTRFLETFAQEMGPESLKGAA